MSKKKMFFSSGLDNDTGLTSYWKFNGNANDSVGSNNGTSVNMNYVLGGLIGGVSANFSNSGISYITVPDSDTLSFDSDFSIVCLLFLNNTTSTPRIYNKRNSSSDFEYILIYQANRLIALKDNLNGGILRTSATDAVPLSNWFVSTVTFNASTGTLKQYINKNLNNTVNNTGTFVAMENTTAPLVIGIDSVDLSSGNISGAINALGIYKGKELTSLEVEANVDKFLIDNEHLI